MVEVYASIMKNDVWDIVLRSKGQEGYLRRELTMGRNLL